MAITYGFFNAIKQEDGTYDRVYNSDQISEMFEGLVTDGVYESVGEAMIVKATSGMTVQVGTGRIVMSDGKWLRNDARYNITLAGAHLTLNRWSAIVVQENKTDRTITIMEKAGTPATNPTKPSATNTAAIEEKILAYVYVGKGVTEIGQMNITDVRADNTVCGWVTGVVKQVDTSELFLQYQDAYEKQLATMQTWETAQKTAFSAWETEQKVAFDAWFSTLTDQLQVNTYVQKYHKAVETTDQQGVFALDMAGYTYSSSDIIFVNVNGIALVEEYEWLLDTSKTPVELHTSQGLDADNLVEITILKSKIGQA